MANKTLTGARKAKDDEFYTRFDDINLELQHYTDQFKDKVIYCNCDDGQWSNFWKFFYVNFEAFELKKLIATSYHDGISHTEDPEDQAYEYIYEGGYGKTDYVANNYMEGVTRIKLEQKGDFRSEECIKLLEEADIVVTNPPFSLFREFVATLEKYNKQYIIIGNKNALTYKEIFPLIKDNKLWLGYTSPKEFDQPDGHTKKQMAGLTRWFTNVDIDKRHHILECYSRYDAAKYPKYDNYDAIECGEVKDIPCDYTEERIVDKEELDRLIATGFDIEILEEINE